MILGNYGQNETVGFRERRGQNLYKVGQSQSNITAGLVTTRLAEIRIPILIFRIGEYGDTLVLVKFETDWMVRLREQSRTGTLSISRHT